MAEVVLDISAAAFEAWALSPDGPIVALMAEKGALVEELAKKNAPKGRTGDLEESIQMTPPVIVGGRVEVTVEATAPYALYVHEGTRPHVIEPRTARVLAWEGPDGPVFSRRVSHPGTKANPFLQDAVVAVIA
ncbi:HK97 gp10 family phage protein [uncultured Jatrophihabitans sp.]|uniref:HK97 gp10 family phage protein n=1 Tax=uncultured Jatrophihabitans sp. TaxID=1610747 RepID=UPI0035CC5FA5